MNALMDLTGRAVSFVTLMQQAFLRIPSIREHDVQHNPGQHKFSTVIKEVTEYMSVIRDDNEISMDDEAFAARSVELVWVSKQQPDAKKAKLYTLQLFSLLQKWFADIEENEVFKRLKSGGNFPTPNEWREAIREVLYSKPEEMVKLAAALHYLPMEVLLALGGGTYSAHQQGILQMWNVSEQDKAMLLSDSEIKLLDNFEPSKQKASFFLENNDQLLAALLENKIPVAFEYIYNAELEEIENNRTKRFKEKSIINNTPLLVPLTSKRNDPYKQAEELKLCALAFSGGGIRSATFNLGILQGLAKRGVLENFDYLSTVSGGGYIGSWLAAWIKRDGSVTKVSNRLNPDRSPVPSGEEVRPIKWLRMFSNYFAPKSGIMSADSWTIGVTWLRNTLLNQLIIFLLLMSVMFAGRILFEIWNRKIIWPYKYFKGSDFLQPDIFLLSIILLMPVALLAGLGMHAYHSPALPVVKIKREQTGTIAVWILSIAFMGAFLISGFLYSTAQWSDCVLHFSFAEAIKNLSPVLTPVAIVTFAALLLVAMFGKYHNCFKSFGVSKIVAGFILIITAAVAAVIAQLCLTVTWYLLHKIKHFELPPYGRDGVGMYGIKNTDALGFLLGVPLVLEVFSITVVARMALLGKYFPDERREWWGRIGALVHRFSFIWLLVMGAAFFGGGLFGFAFNKWGQMAFGGWATLVGFAVKAAMSSKTSGKGDEQGKFSAFLNIFGKVGPYLFVLGCLIFLPQLLTPLLNLAGAITEVNHSVSFSFILALLTIGFATLLARQVGVNEFSMHHFYRNRLVRAYLGATRRRMEREKTYNPFTGFDSMDDEKLSKFTNDQGYYGPYPILNTAVNATQVTELDRQDRQAESFIFSPFFCGFDVSSPKASANSKTKSYDYAYRQTKEFAYKDGGPGIGTAMAVSGAAINPNHGYHSSRATAFLLTVFNVQMGWWIGNPRKSKWQSSDPKAGLAYIVHNLIGQTNTSNDFLCLSDGGHFDNMGLYELVRRRCSFIILCDAEQDEKFKCEGFANSVRRCRIDFGAEIDIDLKKIIERKERISESHFAFGKIKYAGDKEPSGKLLYIKSSINGDEPVDVQEYSAKNETFPHQSTSDQFFDEEQFESYRKLGLHITDSIFTDEVLEALNSIFKPETLNSSDEKLIP